MITSDARTTCGLFGKIEQRIIDLFCAAGGAFVVELCQAFLDGQLHACINPEFKQDMDNEGLVVDVDSDRIAYRLLLDNPFANSTSSRPMVK